MFALHSSINMVLGSEETVLPIQFAVIAFLLQKHQQGVSLPKHLPLPLRSLLPARPVESSKNVWEIPDKKLVELKELWSSSCNKHNQMTHRTAKGLILSICKHQPTCRQMYDLSWAWT